MEKIPENEYEANYRDDRKLPETLELERQLRSSVDTVDGYNRELGNNPDEEEV